MSGATPPIWPRDFARLLLASDAQPRARARDQQADQAGLALRRRLLEAVLQRDPPPDQFEVSLTQIVGELAEPSGPARALALGLLREWEWAQSEPSWLAYLLEQAVRPANPPGGRRGQQLPG